MKRVLNQLINSTLLIKYIIQKYQPVSAKQPPQPTKTSTQIIFKKSSAVVRMGSLEFTSYPKVCSIEVNHFLTYAKQHLEWGDLSFDIVMDIGYGIEDNSSQQFVEAFPDVQKIVSIDSKPEAIAKEQEKHPHPKIEYCVADIKDITTLTPWLGRISIVMSMNSYKSLDDQILAFTNVYKLLVLGGEAVFMFCLSSSFYDVYTDIAKEPRWKEYFKDFVVQPPESHIKKLDTSFYLAILRKIGFDLRICNDCPKCLVFSSEKDCRDFVTNNSMTRHVPLYEREEFKRDLFKMFLKHHPQISMEQPEFYFRVFAAIGSKSLGSSKL